MYFHLSRKSVKRIVDKPEECQMPDLKVMLWKKYGLVLECAYFTSGWYSFCVKNRKKLEEIAKRIKGQEVCPSRENIFRVMIEMEPRDVKCIIIGQDPYYNGQACGLAFAHEGGSIPASLRNIIKELRSDGYNAKTSDLTRWVKQGVMLLNTSLTTIPGKAGEHITLWSKFTEALLEFLSETLDYVVLILWGAHAQSYKKFFGSLTSDVIVSAHPSPRSADKGFFGSKPFSKANKFLRSRGKEEIDWSL